VVDDLKDKEDSNGHVEFLYMATHLYKTLGTGAFLLDGAATVHMVEDWVELQDERVVQMQVKGVGNMMATAKGSLCVGGMKLQPALRVPGLGINLISEGLLQQQGFEVVSRDNWRRVLYKGEVVIEAFLEHGLFVWRPKDVKFIHNNVEHGYVGGSRPESLLHLWHLRMGHLNVDSLRKLQTVSTGMPVLEAGSLPFCIACCKSKSTVRSFKGNGDKATMPLGTIYGTCGVLCNLRWEGKLTLY
jgi:hypothetical protein